MSDLNTLQPLQLAPMQTITGWEDFYRDGKDYLRTVSAAYDNRKAAFTAVILYNMISMAIEKFVMAALMHRGAMPYNHTMADLVEALELTFQGAVDRFRDELLALDAYQEICDLDAYSITPPSMEEIPGMLELARKVQRLAVESTGGGSRQDI